MALEAPEAGWVWLHVPRRDPVDVIVLGDICTWWAHFTRPNGGKRTVAVRCVAGGPEGCSWCAAEVGRKARYVFPVKTGEVTRLVELGRVQYATLAMIYDAGRWVGSRLRLRREWDAVNARIAVDFLGREHLSEELWLDCSDYVSSLGLAEYRMHRPPARDGVPPSKGSAPQVERSDFGVPPSAGVRRWSGG